MTGKERAGWRAKAQQLEPIVHIGRDGITDNVVRQTDEALTARELIKCAVQRGSEHDARSACDELAARTGAEPISVIGRRFVLYRYSPDKHKKSNESHT